MKIVWIIVAIVVVVKGLAMLSARQSPEALGLTAEGKLRPCPDSPNAVCSEDPDPSRRVDPFAFAGSPQETREAFRQFLESRPGVSIQSVADDYLHATVSSRVFGFVDDVEFRFADGAGVIHCRSASRVGYSDLGANRKRLTAWRQAWEETAR